MTAYAHNSLARSVTQTPFETVGTALTANKFVLSRPGLSHGILKPKTIVYWAFPHSHSHFYRYWWKQQRGLQGALYLAAEATLERLQGIEDTDPNEEIWYAASIAIDGSPSTLLKSCADNIFWPDCGQYRQFIVYRKYMIYHVLSHNHLST